MSDPNLGWALPPGMRESEVDGPEATDEDGITLRQRQRESALEDRADAERNDP